MANKKVARKKDKLSSIAGKEYESVVKDLAEKCELAKQTDNRKIKEAVLDIIRNWKRFFQIEKESIKKMKGNKGKDRILKFIDEQIKYLDSLSKKVRK